MAYHRSIRTLFYHITERRQLDVVHLFHRTGHGGQGQVRVSRRVAVTREVFHRGNQALTLHTESVCSGFLTHSLRILAKATHSDNRISRIGVDIGHWSKVDMNAHALALFSHLLPHLINQFIIGDGAQGHLIRIGQSLVHAHGQTPFRINGNHQRGLCHGLPFVGLSHLGIRIRTEETYATDVVLLDVFCYILIKRLARLVGTHTNQLPNPLL